MSTADPPEPTEDEQEASPDRREEEDEQRYPGHENPERAREQSEE